MTDIDQLLDRATSDVQTSIQEQTKPTSRTVRRRARQRTALLSTGWVLIIGLAMSGVFLTLSSGGDVASTEDEEGITSELILKDGVVTEAEYQAGARAVADCMTEAGFATQLEQDTDGDFAFFTPYPDDTKPGYTEHWERCLELHLSQNVMHGWLATRGDLDLAEFREETTAVFECVEQATGQNFGELTYDEFGYLADQGWQSRDSAFEYGEHEPWLRCQNDLGYSEEYKTQTNATFECVEEKAGQDFGEITFDEFGQPSDDSKQALRDAMNTQGHELWETCSEELGIRTSEWKVSDF